jgi:tryptophanyl-tRNA synthetase
VIARTETRPFSRIGPKKIEKLFLALDKFLEPIRERRAKYDDKNKLREILAAGTSIALTEADKTMSQVKDAMGINL